MKDDKFGWVPFEIYVNTVGLDEITKKDLDRSIKRFGLRVLNIVNFSEIYALKSSDETNKTMIWWTRVMGFMTMIILAATLATLYLTYYVTTAPTK